MNFVNNKIVNRTNDKNFPTTVFHKRISFLIYYKYKLNKISLPMLVNNNDPYFLPRKFFAALFIFHFSRRYWNLLQLANMVNKSDLVRVIVRLYTPACQCWTWNFRGVIMHVHVQQCQYSWHSWSHNFELVIFKLPSRSNN